MSGWIRVLHLTAVAGAAAIGTGTVGVRATPAPQIDCTGCTIEVHDHGLPTSYDSDFQIIWKVGNPNPGASLAQLTPSGWGAVTTTPPYVSPATVNIPSNGVAYVTGYYHLGDSTSCSALCGGAVMTISNSGVPAVYAKIGVPRP